MAGKLRRSIKNNNSSLGCALSLICSLMMNYAVADQVVSDDYIVQGSLCVGIDCVNGENFNYDTIRLKENNLRIKFQDTSRTSSFPTNDWQITANDSANGGLNKFSIEDIDGTTVPFTILARAPNHSIYINQIGNVGFNTSTPLVEMHVKDGNSPTVRLEQDNSSGFTAQAWDMGGNETNFFVRDFTNGSALPFRIQSGAPSSSIHVAPDGDVGFRTSTPDGQFDIAHSTDANNHALLVDTNSYVGVNIDNGFNPRGLFDVQTTGGESRFMVQSDGKVGLGLSTNGVANGLFDVQVSGTSKFLVDNSGNIGFGTSAPSGRFEITNSANSGSLFYMTDSGDVSFGGSKTFPTNASLTARFRVDTDSSNHGAIYLNSTGTNKVSAFVFSENDNPSWYFSARNSFDNDKLVFYNKTPHEVMLLQQDGGIGFGISEVPAGRAISHSNGAHLSNGGIWTDASSRDLKDKITALSAKSAFGALKSLTPVTYVYKLDPEDSHVGFIAEDVPEIVATPDRKGLSSMEITGVLTKVVQEQQKLIEKLNERVKSLEKKAGNKSSY